MVPHLPGFIGGPGWVRSSAWICDFSSIESTTAWAGGCMWRPTISSTFSARAGSALKSAQAMRLQAVDTPNALYRVQRQADGFGHRAAGPVGHLAGWVAAGQRQHLAD